MYTIKSGWEQYAYVIIGIIVGILISFFITDILQLRLIFISAFVLSGLIIIATGTSKKIIFSDISIRIKSLIGIKVHQIYSLSEVSVKFDALMMGQNVLTVKMKYLSGQEYEYTKRNPKIKDKSEIEKELTNMYGEHFSNVFEGCVWKF